MKLGYLEGFVGRPCSVCGRPLSRLSELVIYLTVEDGEEPDEADLRHVFCVPTTRRSPAHH